MEISALEKQAESKKAEQEICREFVDKLKEKVTQTSEVYCKEYNLPERSLYLDDVMTDIDKILAEMEGQNAPTDN